jgi:hypothetical protein
MQPLLRDSSDAQKKAQTTRLRQMVITLAAENMI